VNWSFTWYPHSNKPWLIVLTWPKALQWQYNGWHGKICIFLTNALQEHRCSRNPKLSSSASACSKCCKSSVWHENTCLLSWTYYSFVSKERFTVHGKREDFLYCQCFTGVTVKTEIVSVYFWACFVWAYLCLFILFWFVVQFPIFGQTQNKKCNRARTIVFGILKWSAIAMPVGLTNLVWLCFCSVFLITINMSFSPHPSIPPGCNSIQEQRDRWERKRSRTAKELVQTEQRYCQQLQLVTTVCIVTIRNALRCN